MWSIQNLLSEAEAAKERLVSVIGQHRPSDSASVSSSSSFQQDPQQQQQQQQKEETQQEQQPSSSSSSASSPSSFQNQPTIATIPGNNNNNNNNSNNNEQVLNTLKSTLTSALTATKAATQQAIHTLEKEQTKIQARLFQSSNKGTSPYYLRDISLPLDTESLFDAEVVYITDRLITMGHPAMQSAVNGDVTPERKLAAVQHLLQKRHGNGKYMIWNLSELEYDYSIFDNQVMTFEFPGSPSPPLGLMMKILLSLESWLRADEKNVAVMHCLTGRGRTCTVMSAFLCWVGEAGFGDPNRALEYMAQCKKLDLETLTIPSQRRYVGYFKNMLDGVRPSQPPLLLKRIIMSEVPKFEKYQVTGNDSHHPDPNYAQHVGTLGCAPYLQIFKGGKLVYTTAASKSFHQEKDELPFCFSFEKSITFPMETVVQGDILIRCRHLTRRGQRVSMFRAALHTGYVPPKVLRLRKSEIDGACNDKRFADDFFIDLVFEECSAAMASKYLLSSPQDGGEGCEDHVQFTKKDGDDGVSVKVSVNGGDGTRSSATKLLSENQGAIKITASVYDSMLHRDSRFWDMIAQRRNERNQPRETIGDVERDGKKTSKSPFYGPTIGRRREFLDETAKATKDGINVGGQTSVSTHRSELHAFTIGGELDFTTAKVNDTNSKNGVEEAVKKKESPKDDLMDALMAIDDDIDDEVVHDDEGDDIDTDTDRSNIDRGDDTAVNQIDNGLIATEEVVFYEDPPVDSGLNEIHVEKEKGQEEVEMSAAIKEGEIPQTTSDRSQKNDAAQDPSGIEPINVDDLNIDDMENFNAENQEGDIFSDEDDDIADLEEFLMKASV